MLLTVRRPHHLKPEESLEWLRGEIDDLLSIAGVESMTLAKLGSAGGRWQGDYDWLIELELEDDADPARVVRHEHCASLLGDLRLLGMRPSVVVLQEAWTKSR